MGLRDLLRIPKIHRRARSETRSEIVSQTIEDPSDVGLAVPHFIESTPNFGAGTLASTSSLTPRVKESQGM